MKTHTADEATADPRPGEPAAYVNVANGAPYWRRQWTEIAIPRQMEQDLLTDGAAFCLAPSHGEPGWLHRSAVSTPDCSYWWGLLTMAPNTHEQWGVHVGTPPDRQPMRLHPYVADDLAATRLAFTAYDMNQTPHRCAPEHVRYTRVRAEPFRLVLAITARIPGTPLLVEGFAYCYDQQPHVRLELGVTFATGADGALAGAWAGQLSYTIAGLVLECGEYVHIDESPRRGCAQPARDAAGQWKILLSGPRDLGRAETLRYPGWMLCMPQGTIVDPGPHSDDTYRALTQDGEFGAVLATGWDGRFGALGVVPSLPQPWVASGGRAQADQAVAAHRAAMTARGDMYDQRPLGLQKNAGATGAQEDFGAGQDVIALRVADPRRVRALHFSADGWFLRPCHNRDDLGRPFRFAEHPATRTWSQVPEQRVGSGDQIGWPDQLQWSWGRSGYTGIDDQHRSQELLTCLMSLCESDQLQVQLRDMLEVDIAAVKVHQGALDSPRGEGRVIHALADMLGLLADEEARDACLALGNRRIANLAAAWIGKDIPDDGAHVRPLTLGSTFELPGTQAVVVWEHAIAATGLYAWWRRTGNPQARELCRACCEIVVQYAAFEHDSQWWTAVAFAWQAGGEPLPASAYAPRTAYVVADKGGWWTWILSGALILAHEWPDHPAAAKARRIAKGVYGQGPGSEGAAEWWAVVPREAIDKMIGDA